MPTAYSYIRFSSPEQAKGDSYRRQKEKAERYCAEHGLELATAREYTFFDRGLTAYKGKHLDDEGQLKRFLDLVDNGSIEAGSFLLVESLDRLSREKVNVALSQFLGLLAKGISIVTLSDQRVYTRDVDATELIVSITIMMRAHEESATKGDRVGAAWSNKKKLARSEKKPLGKACPYWLELKDGEYQPIPERVHTVKTIFELCIAGYGQTAIARILNERNIPIFGSSGENGRNKSGAWGSSSINKILKNRALLGEYQPTHIVNRKRINDGPPVEDFFPKVISEELFFQAKAASSQRKISSTTKQTKNFNIWQGIAKCAICNDAMHLVNKGKPPKGQTYLQCHSKKKGVCNNGIIRIDYAEEAFREILTKVDSMSLVQDKSSAILKSLETVAGQLLEAEEKHSVTAEVLEAAPSKAAGRILQELEQKITALQAEHLQLQEQLASSKITSKADFFDKLDLVTYEGRAAANNLLKRLGITARFRRDNPTRFQCWVMQKGQDDDSSTAALADALFSLIWHKGRISLQALSDEIYDRQLQQGELDQDRIDYEKEHGIGWHWISGKLGKD